MEGYDTRNCLLTHGNITSLTNSIELIRTGSFSQSPELLSRLQDLNKAGINFTFPDEETIHLSEFLSSKGIKKRSQWLNKALLADERTILLCLRGGYGASDLISLIPYGKLDTSPPKLVVGFSDVSAIQMALYTKLKWPSLHAPMPGTAYWGQSGHEDIEQLINLLKGSLKKGSVSIHNKTHLPNPDDSLTGTLVGGCLSVLTNLIGTPYLPTNLKGHILFLEDINEPPEKVYRYLNQWLHSGLLEGVIAIVLGHFSFSNPENIFNMIRDRMSPIPIFHSPDFGHCSPNFPLGLGSLATIKGKKLNWEWMPHMMPIHLL